MGGIKYTDRLLGAEVRNLTLKKIKALFELARVDMTDRDRELYEAVLIKLAGSVLPRLQEVTGEAGAPLVIQISKEVAEKTKLYDIAQNTGGDSEGQASV